MKYSRLIIHGLSAALTLLTVSGAALAEGALDQLKQGANHGQVTGRTFDNAHRPLPSDAAVKAKPIVTSPAPGYTVVTSSQTVQTSTGTATAPQTGAHQAK
ncbi:MAG TPA: hypothetical protein VGY54_13510 [Polyangiaceae bacterium]|jgi:hypothetical protein|nr:hypothetical protein [Polyangiaceae bacterium]